MSENETVYYYETIKTADMDECTGAVIWETSLLGVQSDIQATSWSPETSCQDQTAHPWIN